MKIFRVETPCIPISGIRTFQTKNRSEFVDNVPAILARRFVTSLAAFKWFSTTTFTILEICALLTFHSVYMPISF